MKKIPHKYKVIQSGEYKNLVTRRFTIPFNGINYYNEISALKDDETPVFTLLRALAEAKHQMVEDLYRIKGNIEGN